MRIKLLDYMYRPTEVDIGDIEDILCATLKILSGDETLSVIHKDGSEDYFDSSHKRIMTFDDGSFVVYVAGEIDILTSKRFSNRTKTWDIELLEKEGGDVK